MVLVKLLYFLTFINSFSPFITAYQCLRVSKKVSKNLFYNTICFEYYKHYNNIINIIIINTITKTMLVIILCLCIHFCSSIHISNSCLYIKYLFFSFFSGNPLSEYNFIILYLVQLNNFINSAISYFLLSSISMLLLF